MSSELDDLYRQLSERFHKERSSDSVYLEGYNASKNDENPYPFPEKLDRSRMRISTLPRALTEKEKKQLEALNKQMYATEWQRWSSGYWTARRLKND